MPRYSASPETESYAEDNVRIYQKGGFERDRTIPTIDPKFMEEIKITPHNLKTSNITEEDISVDLNPEPKFDVVDLLMAQFAWEACQLNRGFGFKENEKIRAKLSTQEKKNIEDLLEQYRVYVQTNNISIKPKSRKYGMVPERIYASSSSSASSASQAAGEEILNGLNQITFNHELFSRIPTKVVGTRTIVDEEAVKSHFYDEADDRGFQGFMDQDIPQPAQQAQELIDRMQGAFEKHKSNLSKREQQRARNFLGLDANRQGDVDAAERLLVGQDEMMRRLSEIGVQQDGSYENPELAQIRDSLQGVSRMTKDMATEIQSLREAQIRNDGLDSVAWWDLPKWFRLQFAQGFWKFTLFCVTLPITIPVKLVNNIIVKPAWYTTKFLFEKLYLLWGFMMIFVIIGTTLHVYYTNEEAIMNMFVDMSTYAKENLTFVSDYIFYPLKKGYENTATQEELMAAWKRFLGGMFGSLWATLTQKLLELKEYIAAALWETFKSYNPLGGWSNPFSGWI